jgi:hypothetical protein
MVEITRAVETQVTYVNHYHVDDSVIVEKFGSIKRFEELLNGADESEQESEAMSEIQELLNGIDAAEYFTVEGDDDETSFYFGHIDPNARMFRK